MPAALVEGVEALLDTIRQDDIAVDQFQDRTIGLFEAGGDILDGKSLDLPEDVLRRI